MGLFNKFKSKEKEKTKEPIIIKPIKTRARKYWGYCYNEKFNVYCNGATVYVYDKDDNELARFKDVPYAHRAKFMSHTNILVVKSTTGYLVIYDLDTLSLLKKIVVTQIGAQDEGLAFTPDGKFFCNIEKPIFSLYTQVAVYRTTDFKRIATLFQNNKIVNFKAIEFDENNRCYVLEFIRNDNGVYDYGFFGNLEEKGLTNIKKLSKNNFDYIRTFKNWEDFGFTEKEYENSNQLKDKENIEYISLKDLC